MDAARAALLPCAAPTRADRAIAFRAVLWTAAHLLRYTDIVICDGGFGQEEDRDACRALARESGAALYWVEFTAPLDILLGRNRARRGHHPGLDLSDERVAEIVESYPWTGAGLVVYSSRPLAECIAAVGQTPLGDTSAFREALSPSAPAEFAEAQRLQALLVE